MDRTFLICGPMGDVNPHGEVSYLNPELDYVLCFKGLPQPQNMLDFGSVDMICGSLRDNLWEDIHRNS